MRRNGLVNQVEFLGLAIEVLTYIYLILLLLFPVFRLMYVGRAWCTPFTYLLTLLVARILRTAAQRDIIFELLLDKKIGIQYP